ncbi:MAG: L-glyceraldehyde 3-phosphate reductase [Treponema sp.]|jgi:L-glyceraldehyde 3-phosphate reductase|nr:L-glyceraldehyde 3-phosphate reductase [Treponema sp.]
MEYDVYTAKENRYEKMHYARCGSSGLQLSRISLGFWHNFGDAGNFDTMRALCRTAFDAGITCFDLANNYGPAAGSAEENFGRIYAKDFKPYRDELVITTKAGYFMWNGPYGDGGSRKYLLASLDQSLKRMGLDYVDIFYHHRMDKNTPLEESMEALNQAVKSGKALYAGISNYDRETTVKAVKILKELHCPFVLNQVRYNIFDRHIEKEGLKTYAGQNGIGLICFSPLAQGLLTGKYLGGIPEDSRIAKKSQFLHKSDLTEERLAQIKKLDEIADARGQTLAQMALSWILRDNDITSVLIGASKPEQITENCKILEAAPFTEDERTAIDAAAYDGE